MGILFLFFTFESLMNKKGFTLIELLIVVAIIGILAAVGAAVIPGLLENTKINATKAIHTQTLKYIGAQIMKCHIGESHIMGTYPCANIYPLGTLFSSKY